jgi:membrane peptidoglycan carboxypeptidase
MTLKDALAQSINVVAVKLLYLVGIPDAIKMAHDLGISTLNDPTRYGLSLVIGGGETTLLDMTSVYGVFANEGVRHPHTGILSIEDSTGKVLQKYEDNSYSVLDPNITRILSDILSDNVARAPTFTPNSALVVPGHEVAVKTGTTNNNKDAWTIGYTPSVAVGVWVGNNDNTPMKKGGAALAGPIWNAVISESLKTLPVESFNKPNPIDQSIPPILRGFWQGGETFTIDKSSGKLATEFTPLDLRQEKSITNVHSILYWINKSNPLGPRPSNPQSDPQYTNWEYGVANWWALHKNNYTITTANDKPTDYETNHTTLSKPVFEITGLTNENYPKNQPVTLNITTQSQVKKIDVFVNDTYITSLKNSTSIVTFTPKDVANIDTKNTIHIIGYDTAGNSGETSSVFFVR